MKSVKDLVVIRSYSLIICDKQNGRKASIPLYSKTQYGFSGLII